MHPNIPASAAILLDFIASKEAPKGYNVIFGNNQGKLPKPITAMTLDELIKAQVSFTRRFKSSASGRYQFMRATLKGLKKEMDLTGSERFTPDFQDMLGYHLLVRRGYLQYMAGAIGCTEFGKRIAKEWASFPVLKSTKGAHRNVKRGQSYYSGDALNKALVSAAEVERVLDRVKQQLPMSAIAPPVPDHVPVLAPEPAPEPKGVDKPMPRSKTGWGAAALGAVGSMTTFLSDIDWRAQIALMVLFVFVAGYIWFERRRIAKEVRRFVASARGQDAERGEIIS